jgi:nucleoside-triphosphatase THEP1
MHPLYFTKYNGGGKPMERHKLMLWRKAAVLGGMWAASEIVLGTFLHNARVPFSGEFLTFIGIAIMTAGHRLWPERGLLWRTGLVCAAMKSISPSAVIFGPMLAISMEGFLAEAGLRLLGGNIAGYALAGALAMSWAIVQKTGTLLVYYGPDAVNIYLRGIGWLHARTGLVPGGAWSPLLLLLALYFIAGTLAAAAGYRAAISSLNISAAPRARSGPDRLKPAKAAAGRSIPALIAHFLLVAAVMAAGRAIPLPALCAAAAAYAGICALSYPRAAALLRRAGVWAGVLGVSLTAGLIMGNAAAGCYMAVRAFVLTFGFSAIGSELTNPLIRSGLERLGAGVFFETLEYAFGTLPEMISALPSGWELLRSPAASLSGAVSRAPALLAAINNPRVFIITGANGSGKSRLVMALAEAMRGAGKNPGGICAAGLVENGAKTGFDLVSLSSGLRTRLCRRGPGGTVRSGDFRFFEEGLEAGTSALSPAGRAGSDAVFVDEVGFLELDGGGWAGPVKELLLGRSPVVLVVRDYLVERVAEHFGLERPILWKAGGVTAELALRELFPNDRAR